MVSRIRGLDEIQSPARRPRSADHKGTSGNANKSWYSLSHVFARDEVNERVWGRAFPVDSAGFRGFGAHPNQAGGLGMRRW